MLRFILVLAVCVLRCASSPSRGGSAGGDSSVRVDETGQATDRFEKEYDPEAELLGLLADPDKSKDTEANNAGERQNAAPPPPPAEPEPKKDEDPAFANQLDEARRIVASGPAQEAKRALEGLEALAKKLGADALQQVLELEHRAAQASKDPRWARRSAEKWLLSCGPERVDACRRKALNALRGVAKLPGMAKLAATTDEAAAADECLMTAGKDKQPDHPCVAEALKVYQRMRDKLMVARVLSMKATALVRVGGKEPQAVRELSRAENACREHRCSSMRRRLLRSISSLYLKIGRPKDAAKAALQDVQLAATELPDEWKHYAWTPELERACDAMDAADGEGSCRRFQLTVMGRYTFRDFSREVTSTSGEGLGPDEVKRVNQHFNVLLQSCLQAEAARLVPPAVEKYHVRWAIRNTGRVEQLRMDRPERQDGPFAQCLREQLSVWRYPRFSGELQHVEQSFMLHARTRRSF